MRRVVKPILTALFGLWLSACGGEDRAVTGERSAPSRRTGETFRVATFNVSLFRDEEGGLREEMRSPGGEQLEAIRTIVRRVDPDILVLNEFDFDEESEALDAFAAYLELGYAHRLALPSNTGLPSGLDLDGDGRADHPPGSREYGNDALGYGIFPGQYAIGILSRFPIEAGEVRTFRQLLWRDMPGNLLPSDFYSGDAQERLRLSSKTHADVPVRVGEETLHLVLAHPTPPGFDGPEDRNGRRNYDEVRLLLDYVTGTEANWLKDDEGGAGGLAQGSYFVVAGDLNADPVDSAAVAGREQHAIEMLLNHPATTDPRPTSRGGTAAAARQGGGNLKQNGDPSLDTGDFSDGRVGNLRVDYVIPSSNLGVRGSGVFWPAPGEEGFELVGPGYPPVSSDHRLVFVDLAFPTAE